MNKAVEGREFVLFFAAAHSGRLTARRVRLEHRGGWRLEHGTVELPARAPVAFKRATLLTAGPQVGELRCETASGPVCLKLLSLIPRAESPAGSASQ